jgi:predicted patatin/cPLA2 family phospholipase
MKRKADSIATRKRDMKKEIKAFHKATEKYLSSLKTIAKQHHPSEAKKVHNHIQKIQNKLDALEKKGAKFLK